MLLAFLLALQTGPLADLRVGEDADAAVARVMVVCTTPCSASPSDDGPGAYRIDGLRDAVDVRVDGPLIERLTVTPDGEASLLTVRAVRPPRRVRLSRCQPDALCFDMDLSDAPPPPRPPTLGTIARGVDEMAARGAPRPLRTALEAASGERLTPAACEDAYARLMADAHALGAFRTHALCVGANGAPGEADGYLARLAAYAPDETLPALRALLAEAAGASPAP